MCAIRSAPGACAPGVDPGCDIVDVSIGPTNGGQPCAVFSDGSARCWSPAGTERIYLGNGTMAGCVQPGLVRNLTGVQALQQGRDFACAVRTGQPMPVWCWGSNLTGPFGMPTPAQSLVPIATPISGPGTLVLGGASGFSITSRGAR